MSKRFGADDEILKGCFAQDRAAMEEFVRKFSKLVYYSIHQAFKIKGVSVNQDEIEDLFGEIFLSFFDSDFAKLKSFEGRNGCSLASWIRLIASRRAIDFLRERSRSGTTRPIEENRDENPFVSDSPEDELLGKERAKLLSEILPKLPPDDITFINLYYEKELEPEKIAEILGVGVGTVYSKKHRLQEKLRDMLKNFKAM